MPNIDKKMKDKSVVVVDRGLFTHLAERLARDYGQVFYFLDSREPFPHHEKTSIGRGLEGVQHCLDLFKLLEGLDPLKTLLFFPDIGNGHMQCNLRQQGWRVCGSGKSEIMEIDKILFKKASENAGLPTIPYTVVEGFENLVQQSKGWTDVWFKVWSLARGTFETFHHVNWKHSEMWFHKTLNELGASASTIKILVEKNQPGLEVGDDNCQVNGVLPPNGLLGYELKDKGYIGKWFNKRPKLMDKVNKKMEPVFKALGYQGAYHTEIRIADDGTPFYIDVTAREGCPTGGSASEMYSNYSQGLWDLGGGVLPQWIPTAPFVAELMLCSEWYEHETLYVEIPMDLRPWVKLCNHTLRDNCHYCIPNNMGGTFGSVVALGKTAQEAAELAIERAKRIVAQDYHAAEGVFESLQETMNKGAKHGIDFTHAG
jgi:hypothetical protein